MPARLIDGRAHARAIREELKLAVERHPGQRSPGITVIQVGDDLASTTYVRGKHKAAEEVGFKSAIAHLHDITQAELNNRIRALADDPAIDGILVQMPLPDGLDPDQALEQIPPHKDVDGLHPYNAGRLAQGNPSFIPATPLGVLELLRRERIDPTGQHVKPGAIVIDVGITRDPETGKLTGDVDRASVESVAQALTPVPGGVGPMTVAMLLVNTYRAYRQHLGQS